MREKSQYVHADRCNGCGECSPVCPIEIPNYFEMNLAPRKAIYVPMSQSVPLVYTIDMDACIQCYKCVDACPEGSLSLSDGVIAWDAETCTRCEECLDPCPEKAVAFDPVSDRINICDLCGGKPLCIEWCPEDVISL